MKRKLWLVNNGDSVSVDSRGDIHFHNCVRTARQEPPESCEGWDKAEKYPYRVHYARENGSFVSSDIQKLICPTDCKGDCKLEQWQRQEDTSVWEVQDGWWEKKKDNHPWNSLGVSQQDADRHGQSEDR